MKVRALLSPLLQLLVLLLLWLVLFQGTSFGEMDGADEQNKVRIHIGELQHDIKVQLDKIEEKMRRKARSLISWMR